MGLSKTYNIWNKNFISVFFINFVICLVFYMSTVACTDFAKVVLNASTSLAGLANGVFVIGALVSRLYFGSLIDRINIKKTMLYGLILYLIPNFYYIYLNNITELIVSRIVAGICYGVISCACGAAIARLVPSNKRGIGIGYYAISVILSSAFGPFMAVYFISSSNFTACFLVSIFSIIAALYFAYILKVRRYKKIHHEHSSKFSIYNYLEKSVVDLAYVVFCLGFAYGGILAFIGTYSKEIGLVASGSIFFLIYAVVSVFSRPIAGKLFDKIGANVIIMPSLIFFSISLLLLAYANNAVMIVFSAVFCALGYGNASSSSQSLAIKICPSNKTGLANSTFFIALDVGMGVSPYLLGIIEPHIGYSNIFILCAIVILFSLLLYYLLIVKKPRI